jgi:hypothetical protein
MFDDALLLTVIHQRDGIDRRFVVGERRVRAGDKPRQRVERLDDQPLAHLGLRHHPLFDETRPLRIGLPKHGQL